MPTEVTAVTPASTPAVVPATTEPKKTETSAADEKTGRQARLAALVKTAKDKKEAEKPAGDKPAASADGKPAAAEPATKPADKPSGYATKRIADLETENATLKANSRDAFVDEIKKDHRVLLRALGGNGDELLLALAEAQGKERDPEERIKYEVERQTADLRKKAEDADKKEAEAKANERKAQTVAATKNVFENGFKDGEEQIADPTKWKLSAKLTKSGHIDAPAEGVAVVSALVRNAAEAAKKAGKEPKVYNDRDIATMLSVAFDAIEKREQTKKSLYADDENVDANGKPIDSKEELKQARITRKTLTSRVGYGQTVGREESKQPKARFDRRQERLAKLR